MNLQTIETEAARLAPIAIGIILAVERSLGKTVPTETKQSVSANVVSSLSTGHNAADILNLIQTVAAALEASGAIAA